MLVFRDVLRRRGGRLVGLTAVAAALSLTGAAQAQLPPLVEVSGQYLPSSEVPGSGGLRAQVASYDAVVNVPMVLGENTFLVPGAQYHVDGISYSNEPPGFTPLELLHSVDLAILFAQRLSPKWTLSLRAWPGAAGDFEAFDSGIWRVGGLAMATWSASESLLLGGGAMASYAFGELLPLPLLYAEWKPSRQFRFEASLPFFAGATFTPFERLELGALADVNGNEYAIRDAQIRERYPCRAGVDDPTTPANEASADPRSCVDHLAYSLIAAGGVARVRLVSSLWFTAFLGRTLFRRYDLKNAAGDSVPGGKVDLLNELAFRAGLVFRIPMPDEAR